MASLARIAFARALAPRATTATLSPRWAARRTYTTPANGASQPPRNLAAEALAQKTGHAPSGQTQATAPKGKNKPSKIEKTPTSPAVYALYALLGVTTVGLAYNVGEFITLKRIHKIGEQNPRP